jgi:serine/threonine protein kinase
MSSNINDYEKLVLIGEGVYGRVYKARCRTTGEIVALKSFKPMVRNATRARIFLLSGGGNYETLKGWGAGAGS